ncbi:hypothetical protein DHEL01_v204560 [Diaporthe helianthi]|uniref:Zn(2)-C6 fungal-type domain-containing protein n=1 Tax=Diaporthe helianthi TaxID=158607 RepID=A0A2P5I3F2_DIAHE|nr:hypothetical protein DHEL01_v204560 [Diaporthe helianthi]
MEEVVASSSSSSSNPLKRPRQPATSTTSKGRQSNKRLRDDSSQAGEPTCKTCTHCRIKKIKCTGGQTCSSCLSSGIECVYPQDTRRLTRPSHDRLAELEQRIDGIWQHIQATTATGSYASVAPQRTPQTATASVNLHEAAVDSCLGGDNTQPLSPQSVDASSLHHSQFPLQPGTFNSANNEAIGGFSDIGRRVSAGTGASNMGDAGADASAGPPNNNEPNNDLEEGPATPARSALSPWEARIAGLAVAQDGGVSVHGASSLLHHGNKVAERIPAALKPDQQVRNAEAKARLMSYAAIQRQREGLHYRNPPPTMDLDGVDVELARHLLDLHWNRQHYAYLLTYRPAIMDSLASRGRWCNKLLLNAMYYTSCLYSDRECLRTTPTDTQSAGDRFYHRFRVLLADEIVNPSIPSAAALLLVGAALVSQGRQSAGWTLCGTAYRMIIDLGCHLTMDTQVQHRGHDLEVDIEREWRRRIYWGALITDATQCLYLGRQMTMRPNEGRVPLVFLDKYEELEEWTPLIDRSYSSEANMLLLSYRPHPAYALSSFTALVKLALIASRITQTFYSIDCVRQSHGNLWSIKREVEDDLKNWQANLPTHLRFDPVNGDDVPPPHQITPHTTYHVLNILLQRPFLDGGYLQEGISEPNKKRNEESCADSALAIWKLVSAYRDTFTLRRAPFLLSYAVYSSVVVMLRRSKTEPERFKGPIAFFLTALSELQRGCNFGLRKPVSIIRDMLSELGDVGLARSEEHPENERALACMMQMYAASDLNIAQEPMGAHSPSACGVGYPFTVFEPSPQGFFDLLDDQEQTITNDMLYGLFSQPLAEFTGG